MAAGIQFTSYVPTSLVGNNSPSPTLAAEVVTGLPIPTGAFPGNVFYLTEQQANQLSAVAVNGATQMTCHAGWYMVVQVSPSATAGNIKAGYIGSQYAQSSSSDIPAAAIVSDADTAFTPGVNPVVFLNPVTPGNYTIVQVAGDTNVYGSAALTEGDVLIYSDTTGEVADSSGSPTFAQLPLVVGIATETTGAAGLGRANVKFLNGIV